MATDIDEKTAQAASQPKPGAWKLKPFFYDLAELRDVSKGR
ncbi:MAG TPA: hypothetical protein VKB84_18670 [Candidatus Binataceae bacterium]|jgi:hypothetical protein|nr:hypothetical protein [Candidatus Binataceae bacterium]